MDWQPTLIGAIPAIISGIVSYFLSIRTSKAEINRIKEIHKSEIEKLEMTQKHELEKLELEYKKKDESDFNKAGVGIVSNLFDTAFKDPKKFKELEEMFSEQK